MSYELDSTKTRKCACGKGQIVEKDYSNDWFQYKTDYIVLCEDCREMYHIEHDLSIRGDHVDSVPYLVPNGKTLSDKRCYNCNEIPFFEQLCLSFKKSDLEHAHDILCSATTYSKIGDHITKKIGRYSKNVLKTMRISTVKDHVNEAINMYSKLDSNYDLNYMRAQEAKQKSVCVYSLDEVK